VQNSIIPQILLSEKYNSSGCLRYKILIEIHGEQLVRSGIGNLTNTGDFIIPAAKIALSEKSRDKITNNYHEDFSDASKHSRNSDESL
jgi:hypothetical protein